MYREALERTEMTQRLFRPTSQTIVEKCCSEVKCWSRKNTNRFSNFWKWRLLAIYSEV